MIFPTKNYIYNQCFISLYCYNNGECSSNGVNNKGECLIKANRKYRLSKDNQAQVGIGTLIIFIAMILVAAVAAAVLIQTSGVLQQKAQKTGKASTQEVSSNVDVDSIEGWRGGTQSSKSSADVFSDELYRLDLRCSLKVGSSPVDMNQAVITITDGTTTNDLRYIEGSLVTAKAYVGAGNGTNAPSAAIGVTNTTYRILVDGDTDSGNSASGHTSVMNIFKKVYPDTHVDDSYNSSGDGAIGAAVLWSLPAAEGSGDVIAVDAGAFNNSTAAAGGYGPVDNSTQDEYFARGDMFYIVDEVRDEDKSFNKDNPVMNTGDMVKVILLTGPSDIVTGSPWLTRSAESTDAELTDNDPLVGEADLNLEPRTSVSISIIPEGGAGTTIDFVTPSSFGTNANVNLYP